MRAWRASCSAAAVAAALAVVAGCGESVGPKTYPIGGYPLAAVNGDALPPPQFLIANGCMVRFVDGWLLIPSKTRFRLELHYGYACPDESSGQALLVFDGSYTGANDNITLNDDVDDGLLTARVKDDYITVLFTGPHRWFWSDPVLYFGPREPISAPQGASSRAW